MVRPGCTEDSTPGLSTVWWLEQTQVKHYSSAEAQDHSEKAVSVPFGKPFGMTFMSPISALVYPSRPWADWAGTYRLCDTEVRGRLGVLLAMTAPCGHLHYSAWASSCGWASSLVPCPLLKAGASQVTTLGNGNQLSFGRVCCKPPRQPLGPSGGAPVLCAGSLNSRSMWAIT